MFWESHGNYFHKYLKYIYLNIYICGSIKEEAVFTSRAKGSKHQAAAASKSALTPITGFFTTGSNVRTPTASCSASLSSANKQTQTRTTATICVKTDQLFQSCQTAAKFTCIERLYMYF